MPFISIQLSQPISPLQSQQLSAGSVEIMSKILRKRADLTAVSIFHSQPENWYIGPHSLSDLGENSAYISALISENSNNEEEKRQAINAFYTLLGDTLGPISETSYIALHEIPTPNWGYGGRTQQDRAVKRTETGAIDLNHYQQKARHCRSIITHQLLSQLFKRLRSLKSLTAAIKKPG